MTQKIPPTLDNDFYKNILESLEDYCVFTTDTDYIITSWNKGAEHVLGYTEVEICGQHARIIYTEDDCKNGIPEHEFAEALEKGRGTDERNHQRKDGSLFWASGLIFPLTDTDNKQIGYTKILRNLSRRKEAEDEALEARKYAQSIVETSKEPMLILNSDLTINSASKPFFKLFDLEKIQTEGVNIFEAIAHKLDTKALAKEMQHYDSFENFELIYTHRNSDEHVLLVSCRKVFQTFKSIGQHLLTFHDVTLQRKLEQAKEDFISVASHELKTPISVIRSYTQILNIELKDKVNERVNTTIGRIMVQSEKLSRLTSFLLDASAFKSGTVQLKKEPFVLLELVIDIVQEMNQANTKHHIAVTEMSDVCVLADRMRISQVLTNLLTNAIKYSPDSVNIDIDLTVDEKKQIVRTSITDHGIGVPAQNQASLFQRFSRTDNMKAQKIEGFGMGLYIAAEIIKAHNGSIGVESDGLQGSAFYFDLPFLHPLSTRK
ncbi:PAS/PAC sensor hybrid histidine kinase [Mucilaginibacter gracilis]|uniref:histidine kinase n=1 Tax=Mucilaginibacter gracilis TaxID=423350 RepID=A0A495J4T6_9SPHI|nr:ATP-binding protein [Mucilaginibacter gracilis]RKR83721.1 PAS/PAC sensor hybrid histidine kinase [Mucilaginibacter gracilis]